MNIEDIVSQLDNQVSRISSDANSVITSGNVNNNPEAMLKAQFAMQQYSVMIGYQSSIMKTVKDMMMSIISKIG
ncbi:EscF/YscF/HrpA family type III secretion system needle major subunit [Edwardsiella ictaluri]|uniref:Type III secretion apparatus needle protein, putative n=2 Tax=Edwardsiella ictaluri TaxID=67780 RepID=C5B9Q0_EDWI9|nr:type III secretion system needle filament subunit SctF [Edwardsiella ictaluri]ABC60064.1 EsaG [Edwardsiella ictaluri 93-146]ACR68152.1 type III secretion apparatus needle protein, putative [Edwardsiella ictaluri 93-146]AQD17737.1 EsaG [Edwardsiella ictaluri]ARD40543.1 EscF/YscF/HrpA family type III secretion system needle major subunit [Edwardsiella ictaluri]AVZ81459.1 EscF/YscF/HrpA family type III secretion system needle major subunit [Edwardsiella ictaluri]